jgi:hypothetical protein
LFVKAKEKYLKAASFAKPVRDAYNIACVCALAGDKAECQKWLKIGEEAGTLGVSREYATSDGDLESVRDEDWFKQINWSSRRR